MMLRRKSVNRFPNYESQFSIYVADTVSSRV